MEIQYNWKYPAVFMPVLSSAKRYVLLSGGRASGKSWFIAHKILQDCMVERNDTLCCREFQNRMSESSHKLLSNIIYKYSLPFTVQENKITCNLNGSEIVFIGLSSQTEDSIKSYENFKRVFIEEGQNISIRSFEILDPTIREEGSIIYIGYNPKNKKDVANHIKETFTDDYLHIHSTYLDNPFASKDTIKQAEAYKRNKPQDYKWIWLGHYLEQNTDLLSPDFSADNMVSCRYVPQLPLHIACDFNNNPNCWELAHVYKENVFFFDEFCHSQNTEKQIRMVLDKYKHENLIIINGDASGYQGRSSAINGSDYMIIENELIRRGYRKETSRNKGEEKLYRIDVSKANGNREDRFLAWNNKILNPLTGEREIFINPVTCPKLVYNMENLELIPGTSKFKEPTPNQILKDPELKFLGHPFDAANYLVKQYFPVKGIQAKNNREKTNHDIEEEFFKKHRNIH